MRWTLENESARAHVIFDGIDLYLEWIEVDDVARRKGQGHALMREICLLADKAGFNISLALSTSDDWLADFYRKHGFHIVLDRIMFRSAK